MEEAKPPRTSFIARLEEAAGKPMWRDAWARARCLIPAKGWYEWQVVEYTDAATGEIKVVKQPHFIRRADGKLLCFAGLMSYWKQPRTGKALRSCEGVRSTADRWKLTALLRRLRGELAAPRATFSRRSLRKA